MTGSSGRGRRTLEDLAKIAAEHDERDPRCIHEILSPTAGGILLFRTSTQGCLTHVARYVSHSTATYRKDLLICAEAECGVGASNGRRNPMIVIDPADETFGCHKCLARCIEYGLPTYSLIPDTGCSATDGQRFRPRPRPPAFDPGPADDFADLLAWSPPDPSTIVNTLDKPATM
jgi:hypothetical protein